MRIKENISLHIRLRELISKAELSSLIEGSLLYVFSKGLQTEVRSYHLQWLKGGAKGISLDAVKGELIELNTRLVFQAGGVTGVQVATPEAVLIAAHRLAKAFKGEVIDSNLDEAFYGEDDLTPPSMQIPG